MKHRRLGPQKAALITNGNPNRNEALIELFKHP